MIISTSLLLPEFLKHVFLGIHLYCHIDPSDKSSAPKSQRCVANPQHTLQLPEGRGGVISQTTKFGYRKKKERKSLFALAEQYIPKASGGTNFFAKCSEIRYPKEEVW